MAKGIELIHRHSRTYNQGNIHPLCTRNSLVLTSEVFSGCNESIFPVDVIKYNYTNWEYTVKWPALHVNLPRDISSWDIKFIHEHFYITLGISSNENKMKELT